MHKDLILPSPYNGRMRGQFVFTLYWMCGQWNEHAMLMIFKDYREIMGPHMGERLRFQILCKFVDFQNLYNIN